LAKIYKTVEVVREEAKRRELPLGGKFITVAKEDVPKFYDDFYRTRPSLSSANANVDPLCVRLSTSKPLIKNNTLTHFP
jgi:hypothetical protein